jgi:hypothetical protein
VILEVVVDSDMWIWHVFFDIVGTHKDINVMQCSLVFAMLANEHALAVNYEINGHKYDKGYYQFDVSIQHGLQL